MNPTRLPKEIFLPNWARRGISGTKGDRVQSLWFNMLMAFYAKTRTWK